MLIPAVCVGVVFATAADPLVVLQLRYPAHRTTVTTSSGTTVYYSLPPDAPPLLRRAYKALEVAEREVLVSEALQLLELDYVNNERKLEALRTAYTASYLTYLRYPSTIRGPIFRSAALLRPPEPAIKWAVTRNITQTRTADRALQALDLLTAAQFQLQETLLDLAFPNRPRQPLPPPLPPPLPVPVPHWSRRPASGLPGRIPCRRPASGRSAEWLMGWRMHDEPSERRRGKCHGRHSGTGRPS